MDNEYEVIIIGAGVLGASTAYHLSKSHKKILIIEQFAIKNDQNTSYDISRILKLAHGKDELKTKMAVQSLAMLKELEVACGKKLFYQCGAYLVGNKSDKENRGLAGKDKLSKDIREKYAGDDPNQHLIDSHKTLDKLGIKNDFLNAEEIKKKYPQFTNNFALLDYGAGIIEASAVVDAFIKLAINNGVEIIEKQKVTKIGDGFIELANGRKIRCKKIVFTAGSFANKLINKKLPLIPLKKELIYLKPKNQKRFKKGNFPIFLDVNTGFYGLPLHGISGIKFGNHYIGKLTDPYTVKREVSKGFIKKSRLYLAKMIPELKDAGIIKSKVCIYEMTPDEEFVIDRLDDQIFIAIGAGHAFKFSPLIGRILSELVLDGKTNYPISRFSLSRFKKGRYGS